MPSLHESDVQVGVRRADTAFVRSRGSATLEDPGGTSPAGGAQPLPQWFELLVDPGSELGRDLAARWHVDEEQCAHILPQALELGYEPQELYDAVVREFGDAGLPLAIKARRRLAEARLAAPRAEVPDTLAQEGLRDFVSGAAAYGWAAVVSTSLTGLKIVAAVVALAAVADLAPR